MSERMIFCLGDGNYERQGEGYQKHNMIFNKQVTEEEFERVNDSMPNIKLDFKDLAYEKAWAKWWSEAKQEDKDKILNCGYFDQEIFTGITGITDFAEKSLSGKTVTVEVDGKKYEAVIK